MFEPYPLKSRAGCTISRGEDDKLHAAIKIHELLQDEHRINTGWTEDLRSIPFTSLYPTLPSLTFWNHVYVVFKRSPKGNMIITKRPDMSNVRWSEAQQAQRALADPKVRARYEQKAKRQGKRA